MFYLEEDKTLHASCVAWIKDLDYDKVTQFTYNSRLEGLLRVIDDKELKVKNIIRLAHTTPNNPRDVKYVYSKREIHNFIKNGMSPDKMIEHFTNIDEQALSNRKDSIIAQAISQQLHANLLRLAAYENLKLQNYSKAIKLAELLNLYYPGITKYMNVIGECHFVSGNMAKAIYYDNHIQKFTNKYGLEQWKKREWDK